MKKLLVLLCCVLTLSPFVYSHWQSISETTQKASEKFLLPFRLARLSAKAPDQSLAMPIASLKVKQVTNTWGADRSGNRKHEGQDLFAPRGTPIYSATEGYVVRMGENSLGGNTVSVLGAGGRVYYYAHLDSYASTLAVGDFVTPNTVLGKVGTTGNAKGTPPHLHFGVYSPGGVLNPLPLLTNRS
jgi:peptidoglycan LD-endopeptidase LytH